MYDPYVETDPNVLLELLNAIEVGGGGDCPELAIEGLIKAAQVAHPQSTMYFFSDADAKDTEYEPVLQSLLALKQLDINFLLTGTCTKKRQTGSLPYVQLADFCGGQIVMAEISDLYSLVGDLSGQVF